MARSHPHTRAARRAAVSILSVVLAVAVVWAAPRASGAVAAWLTTPRVELRTTSLARALAVESTDRPDVSARTASTRTATSGATVATTVDPGIRFTMAGVTCRPSRLHGPVRVLLRTSEDGLAWSRWYVVALERANEQGGEEQAFTEPVWTGPARYLQVAARGSGRAPAELRDVQVVAVNSTEDADRSAAVVGVLRRAAAAVAGLELTPPARAMTTRPVIVTRAEWGADESLRSGSPSYADVHMAFVHHTDSGNDYTRAQAPSIVRGVYAYHTKGLHWSDVGYNFLIDRYGTIYEGRYGGVARGVVGAQVLGFNTGSTGVSIIGTFSSATPPAAAVSSLERLLAWKLDVHHVDPQGTGTLTCGYGQKFATGERVTFPAIAGHRDANYTDCPGSRLYALLPAIRKVVAGIGQPKIYDFSVAYPAISPDGDGVRDRTSVDFTVSQAADWQLEVRDAAGSAVRHFSGSGTASSATWDGKDDGGATVPDGAYTVRAQASNATGDARAASATVVVDTVPPHVDAATVSPDPFSPNGDGQNDLTTLTYRPAEAASVRVSVVDASRNVLRRLTPWTFVDAGAHTVKWDGRVLSAGTLVAAPEGAATLLIEVRDAARNAASVRRTVTLDRTLAFTSLSRRTISPNDDGIYDAATLGFKLTRAATVTATVLRARAVVRTLRLGALVRGTQAATWDGRLDDGTAVTSGHFTFRVTATGTVGVTSVEKALTVDLVAPRVTAPLTAAVAYGKTARLAYSVKDAYSPTVKVTVSVVNAAGGAVATVPCGWVKQGVGQVCVWKPGRRGTYAVQFTAADRGGNRSRVTTTTLTVR